MVFRNRELRTENILRRYNLAATAEQFVNKFSRSRRFKGTHGIAHQRDFVSALKEAASGRSDTNFCYHSIQCDLQTRSTLSQQLIGIWIREDIEGLLLKDDLLEGPR